MLLLHRVPKTVFVRIQVLFDCIHFIVVAVVIIVVVVGIGVIVVFVIRHDHIGRHGTILTMRHIHIFAGIIVGYV